MESSPPGLRRGSLRSRSRERSGHRDRSSSRSRKARSPRSASSLRIDSAATDVSEALATSGSFDLQAPAGRVRRDVSLDSTALSTTESFDEPPRRSPVRERRSAPAKVVVEARPVRAWPTSLCDCCADPGGVSNCVYAWYCPCLAAGEIAKAAGRDYCMSCFVIPVFVPCWMPCTLAGDRAAFARKYGIEEEDFCCSIIKMRVCMLCALCQTRNALLAFRAQGVVPLDSVQLQMVAAAAPAQLVMRAVPE